MFSSKKERRVHTWGSVWGPNNSSVIWTPFISDVASFFVIIFDDVVVVGWRKEYEHDVIQGTGSGGNANIVITICH